MWPYKFHAEFERRGGCARAEQRAPFEFRSSQPQPSSGWVVEDGKLRRPVLHCRDMGAAAAISLQANMDSQDFGADCLPGQYMWAAAIMYAGINSGINGSQAELRFLLLQPQMHGSYGCHADYKIGQAVEHASSTCSTVVTTILRQDSERL